MCIRDRLSPVIVAPPRKVILGELPGCPVVLTTRNPDTDPCLSLIHILWDTYRAAHPFYTLMVPEKVDGFVNSLVEQAEVQGFLPI